jgi:hypothetical protein
MKPGIYRQKLNFESNFTTIPNSWIRNTGLSVNANFLLVYLLTHEIGYNITFNQIEREIGLGETAIRTAMNQLKDAGWLETHRTVDERGYNAGLAWILKEPNMPLVDENPNLANPDLDNPDLDWQGTIENNKYKKTTNKEILIIQTQHFEKFWNAYPRKVAKKSALKAWLNVVSPDLVDAVIAGAIRFAHDPNLPIEQFVPHPATWLRAERWNDGPLPERVKTPEELRELDLVKARERRDREIQATKDLLASEPKGESAPRCEHDRIVAACMKCIRAGKVS